MIGYWADEDRTREVLDEDGWMHTGDLAVMRDDPTAQTSHTPEGFTDEEMRRLRNQSSSATASGVDRDALKQFYVRFAVACVKHSMKEGQRG